MGLYLRVVRLLRLIRSHRNAEIGQRIACIVAVLEMDTSGDGENGPGRRPGSGEGPGMGGGVTDPSGLGVKPVCPSLLLCSSIFYLSMLMASP